MPGIFDRVKDWLLVLSLSLLIWIDMHFFLLVMSGMGSVCVTFDELKQL